jgi:hypothetical protein
MGGTGSGRYGAGYKQGKRTVESKQAFSINMFSKPLKQTKKSSFTTHAPSDESKVIGSITVDPNELYIHFDYKDIDLRVDVDETLCNYGGVRHWFLCPACGRRCGKVYINRYILACRKCCDLNYFSQQHTKTDCYYYHRKAEQVARKIDKDYKHSGIRPIFPPKPKYMKWSAYQKLRNQFYDYDDKAYQVWLRGASYILGLNR